MPTTSSRKPTQPNRRSRRINLKGLAYLGGLVALAIALYFPVKFLSDRKLRSSALAQAREIAEKGDVDLALRHLDRYLITWPDDVSALEVKAKLLGDSIRGPNQILDAANVYDRLIRLDPAGPDRRESRRKLAELYILYSDAARDYATRHPDQAKSAEETRYIAAIQVARQLVKEDEKDAGAHRLLAMALEGQIASGEVKGRKSPRRAGPDEKAAAASKEEGVGKQLEEAEAEYREALRLDPRDIVASERLADLYFRRLNDPGDAETTLDDMLKANPDSVPVRLSRYRAFSRAGLSEKARAELQAALKLDPSNIMLRIEAASEALTHRDPAEARRQLDAIPADQNDQLRVRYLRGMVDSFEQRPDDAIGEWRKGLSLAGGTDMELTWQLARTLISLDRLGEARPLVAQFQRLEKDDSGGLGRYLEAMLQQRSGHPGRAIVELERIQDRVPESYRPEVQLLLGRCYEQTGDESRALLAYRRAATLAPRSAEPRKAIAAALLQRDPEQAIAELDRALGQSPDDLSLLIEVIRVRIVRQLSLPPDRRRWREVLDYLDRAEKIAPANVSLQSLRAEYLASSGDLPAAADLLEKATRGPDRRRPETWVSLATALVRLNRPDEAIRALERATAPDAAGDHASIRIARSRLLAGSGQGQAARDLLTKDVEAIPAPERPALARELGSLLRQMGDRDGARAALAEWARLEPYSPRPGLELLNLARVNDDDEAARLGLEALRRVGGDKELYGLAAQAMDLLRTDRGVRETLPAARLDAADRLVTRLELEAPQFALGHFLKGLILEQRSQTEADESARARKLEEAATAYRRAMKDDTASLTLPRLVEVLEKLKRFDELDGMKRRFDEQASNGQQPGLASQFDRISADVAYRLGDKQRAEYYANQLVEGQPENARLKASLAQFLDQLGKPKEAEAALRALCERKPAEPTAWLSLVAFLAPRRPPAEVKAAIEQARVGYKGERPELLLAQCHWLANDLPEAARLHKEALAKRPDDLTTLRGVAEFDEATGKIGDLEKILRKALQVDPKATWAARALALRISSKLDPSAWAEAWALVAPGSPGSDSSPEQRLVRATILARSPINARRAEAISAFDSLANDLPAASPVGLEARLRLAQAMLEAGRPADAWKFIAPVADDINRPNPTALSIAVQSLAQLGKPDEAARRLDRLVAIEPKSARAAWARAWTLRAKDKPAEAAEAIRSAFADAADGPEAEPIGVSCVDLLLKLGDLPAAEKLAREVATRWPRSSWLLARVQVARKEYDGAFESCRAALEAGTSREALRYATSLAIARRDNPEFLKQVEEIGHSARAKSPHDFDILVFLATIYHLQGRYADEVDLYRQALDLNPPSVQFLNNMAWTLCEGLHKTDEALTRIEQAISREGVNPQFLDTRGVVRGRLGMDEQAIADLELSVKGDPSPTTYFHLARAYLKAGKTDESRRCRDLALKAKFDAATLDPTDRSELGEVMGKP